MFWNVRPSPATTMSFGRALRKTPKRLRNRWYDGGRATPMTSTISRIMMAMKMLAIVSPSGAPAMARSTVTRAAIPAGMSHRIGSNHARLEWAIIVSPWNWISPAVQS